jgi:hypothetical protein
MARPKDRPIPPWFCLTALFPLPSFLSSVATTGIYEMASSFIVFVRPSERIDFRQFNLVCLSLPSHGNNLEACKHAMTTP